MSINNELIIKKNELYKEKPFEVHENLCVDNDFITSDKTILKRFETLQEAIRFANEYCAEYPFVEYGYRILDSCLESTNKTGESK